MNTEKHNSFRHALKYTSIFGGVQGLNVLIGLIRNKFVAVILGPAGMGLVSLYNSTSSLMSNLTGLGLSMSGVRRVSEDYDENPDSEKLLDTVKLIRSLSVVAAIFGTLICMLFSGVLSYFTFGDCSHVYSFMALSPLIGMMAIITGELAVMKGIRMLRPLALATLFNVVAALFISVPLFYFYGMKGIIPSFLLVSFSQILFTMHYSCRRFPFRISLRREFLSRGNTIIKLGVAFVLAGVFSSGSEFLIRLFLNNLGSLDTVGLYNAGYMITIVYGGLVFSAMETDYFPRLSAVGHDDKVGQNSVVNRQVEVSLVLISPMLIAFIIALPVILPLLFSSKFNAVLTMTQVTVLALYMRALKLPLSYMALAKGDSKSFLFLEGVYAVVAFVLVSVMYWLFGFVGTGWALLLTAVLDFLMLTLYTKHKYGYTMSHDVFKIAVMQLPLGGLAFALSQSLYGLSYWVAGIAVTLISVAVSYMTLRRKKNI